MVSISEASRRDTLLAAALVATQCLLRYASLISNVPFRDGDERAKPRVCSSSAFC